MQRSVDVLDLHDGREDQDGKQEVGDWEGDDFPDLVRKKRCDALCRKGSVAAEEPNKTDVDEDALVAILIAREQQHNNQPHGDSEIGLKLPGRNQVPNDVRVQSWVAIARRQHNSNTAAHSNDNTHSIPPTELLMQQQRRNQTIRDQRHDAQRRHNRRWREAIRQEIARLSQHHERNPKPPNRRLQIALTLALVLALLIASIRQRRRARRRRARLPAAQRRYKRIPLLRLLLFLQLQLPVRRPIPRILSRALLRDILLLVLLLLSFRAIMSPIASRPTLAILAILLLPPLRPALLRPLARVLAQPQVRIPLGVERERDEHVADDRRHDADQTRPVLARQVLACAEAEELCS